MPSKRIRNPTQHPERRVEGKRLAYYMTAANSTFWDQHWQMHLSRKKYRGSERGDLGWFEEAFKRYLPREGRILEAGCGLGELVLALRVRGYDVEGVEWASDTVKAVKAIYPDLPIRGADVTCLDVPDGYYSGYISIGVVEHRHEGPEPFLREAYRVLDSGGFALISVPYFHPLRQLKAHLGMYRGLSEGLEFYQYAFSDAEFASILRASGYKIVDQMLYDGYKGVKDEFPLLLKIFNWPRIGWRLQRWLRSWKWAERNLGHMILFVCRKVQ